MVKQFGNYVDADNIETKSAIWLEHVRSRVRPRPHLELRPERCALLVVDMQTHFAGPCGRAYLPASRAVIGNICGILDDWRRGGHLVIYTRHCHEGPEDLGMLGRFYSDYIKCGEPDSEIIDAVKPGPSDLVLHKTTYDAFHGTGLQQQLERRGIEQVLVSGVMTHLCCETTGRSAFVRGFEVYVIADGMADSSEELHLGSLTALADGFAVVLSAAEVRRRCT